MHCRNLCGPPVQGQVPHIGFGSVQLKAAWAEMVENDKTAEQREEAQSLAAIASVSGELSAEAREDRQVSGGIDTNDTGATPEGSVLLKMDLEERQALNDDAITLQALKTERAKTLLAVAESKKETARVAVAAALCRLARCAVSGCIGSA